jgi:hypothetical protein
MRKFIAALPVEPSPGCRLRRPVNAHHSGETIRASPATAHAFAGKPALRSIAEMVSVGVSVRHFLRPHSWVSLYRLMVVRLSVFLEAQHGSDHAAL